MASILLNFKKDENIIIQDKLSLLNEDDGVILHTYFVMPIRFASAKVDFLELNGDPWLKIPLLHFVTVGFDQIIKANAGVAAKYFIPGIGHQLIFERIEDQIQVTSTLNNRRDSVIAIELFQSFNLFVMKIKNLLIEEIPEISTHDYWNNWLKN